MKSSNGILIATGIFPPDIGGPASYGKYIADKLSGSGPVTVVTYSSKFSYPDDKDAPFRILRVWRKWPKGLRHLMYVVKLFPAVRSSKTVLSLNVSLTGLLAMIIGRLFRKKLIVRVGGDYAWERAINTGRTFLILSDFQNSKRSGVAGLLHRIQFRTCKMAHTIIVPSHYAASLVQGWGIPKNKIVVVYNGTDFKPSPLSKEEARKKLGISGNIILTSGRLVPLKGFRMLIKIMPQLFNINQFFKLIILGEGMDKKNLLAMIRNLGLERKVLMPGMQSHRDMATYLAAADMFVLATGGECFSNQILEAMAAGVPVITTAVGGNRELIEQGENGFMVKYNDEFNLIEAIRTLWQNPDLRAEFAKNGKETAGHFGAENMYDETIKVLRS